MVANRSGLSNKVAVVKHRNSRHKIFRLGYTTALNRRLTKISKYLSFILRHHPEKIGLKLDADRWANLDELVRKANSSGKSITLEQVKDVVAMNERKIFVLSDDGLRIRCT